MSIFYASDKALGKKWLSETDSKKKRKGKRKRGKKYGEMVEVGNIQKRGIGRQVRIWAKGGERKEKQNEGMKRMC